MEEHSGRWIEYGRAATYIEEDDARLKMIYTSHSMKIQPLWFILSERGLG
jgi:hypothetical protein